ncbi:MAG: hypothetical protein QW609_02210 [Candidatus Aenigmatarchaeota archaeon]
MKGSIPVSHILAIIFGIIILALIGYWLFMYSGLFGENLSVAECRTRLLSYCSEERVKDNLQSVSTQEWNGYEKRCNYLGWQVDQNVCNNAFKGIYPS